MCYNKEVSMVIFIVSLAIVISIIKEYKINNNINYLFAGLLILAISLIQLAEFFIHYLQDINNNGILYKVSHLFLPIILNLQFIVTEIYLHLTKKIHPAFATFEILYYICAFVLLFSNYKNIFKNIDYKKTCSIFFLGCKIEWGIFGNLCKNYGNLMYILLFCYLLYMGKAIYLIFDISIFIIICLVFIITYLIPLFLYGFGNGSAWCIFSLFLIIMVILLEKSVIRDDIQEKII